MPTQFSSSSLGVRGLTQAALCTACACLLAPVSIPIGPVSLTLGVFAILLAGALLPPTLAVLSSCGYLLLGFAGLPVFAGFAAGPGVLFGITGGYLLAYPVMAWLLAMVCEKTRSRVARMGGVVLANLCCYLLGTGWFMAATGSGLWAALSACVIPFVLPDLAKGWCALWLAERLHRSLSA